MGKTKKGSRAKSNKSSKSRPSTKASSSSKRINDSKRNVNGTLSAPLGKHNRKGFSLGNYPQLTRVGNYPPPTSATRIAGQGQVSWQVIRRRPLGLQLGSATDGWGGKHDSGKTHIDWPNARRYNWYSYGSTLAHVSTLALAALLLLCFVLLCPLKTK